MAEISASAVKELRDKTGAGMMDCKRALADAEGQLEKAVELLRERGLAKATQRQGRATSEGTVAMALREGEGALVEVGCETDFVAKTDDFQALARGLAEGVAADAALASPEAVLAASLAGGSGDELVRGAVGRLGENVELKRVGRLTVEGAGCVGGYVHAGGKLGVLVALGTPADTDGVAALAKDLAMHVAAADPTPQAVDEQGVSAEFLDRERELFRRQAEQEGRPEQVLDRIVEGRVAKLKKEICLLDQPFVKDPDKSVRQLLTEAQDRLGEQVVVQGFVRFKLGESPEA
ncbi:MAG: translation elongation factor Ts [Myxococcota bacterium]